MRLGFIGGGINSAIGTTHKIASQMDNLFQVVSGCFSRDPSTSKATAEQWGIERWYTDYKEFLLREKEQIDAVVVLTPTDRHSEILLHTLNSQIPVICEKTLTASVSEALQIKETLQKTNGFLVTTYNYTGYPMIRELQEMISIGRLGDIIQMRLEMPQESFIRLDPDGNIPRPQPWRLRDGKISTLSLDLGTHLSNMASFLSGASPLEACASKNSFGHHPVTDTISSLIKYSADIDCQIWYSKSSLGHKNGLRVEVYGTRGSAAWYQMNPEFLEFNDNLGKNIILDRSSEGIRIANQERYNRFKSGHPAGFIEAFANHYEDIHHSLSRYLSGEKRNYLNRYVFGIDDSIRELNLMEAIEEASRKKKWVEVPGKQTSDKTCS